MKLVGSLTSPFVRKVRIVLAEKRIDHEFEIDIPWNAETRVGQINPLGKVPVLVLDDGESLFDSRVIVEYLDTLTPVARLIPDIARSRAMVKRWEALADGICDAAVLIMLESRRPAKKQSADLVKRQQGKITQGLQMQSAELGEKPWCAGDAYSLADIATGCCLGYLDFRFPKLAWRDKFPNLLRLEEKLMKKTMFSDTAHRDS